MKPTHRALFRCTLTALALAAGLNLTGLPSASAQIASRTAKVALPDYDVRDPEQVAASKPVATARTNYRTAQVQGGRAEIIAATVQGMARAREALRATVPTLEVENSRFHAAPEAVGTSTAERFLTGASAAPRETTIRGFLADHAALYGLTPAQAAGLVKFSDYANPAGNLSWVGLRQEINGLPVFQGEVLAAFTENGALARTTGNLAVGLDETSLAALPVLTPEQATVQAAAAIGHTLRADRLTVLSNEKGGHVSYVNGGPFFRESKTELMYFQLEPGVGTLAYAVLLWDSPRAYYVLVDANDGTLLFRKCITQDQTQTVTYNVYTGDSPSPLSPTTVLPGSGTQAPGVARQNVTLISDNATASPLGWITDSTAGASITTTGNNCDAGLDLVSPEGIDTTSTARPTTTTRTFSLSYNPPPLGTDAATTTAYAQGAVVNLFFWTNRYHDRLYTLGFTEAARNFQTNNFSRGGTGNDAVSARAHDYVDTDNADFNTPPDGSPGIMRMFLFSDVSPSRDGSLDGDVFLHEMTHGVSNRLHANGSGLATNQSGGMGEGWSDFYARCILSTADEDVDAIYASGGYVTYKLGGTFTDNYYYGIRRFPYAVITNLGANGKPHNPETFADISTSQINLSDAAYAPNPLFGVGTATEVHNIGEVWCSMLLEVRARMIKRLGYVTGNQRVMQIVTDAMKLDVASPTLVQARDSILAADNSGFGGADVADIRAGFAARGMGAGASTNGTTVVESFFPDLAVGNVTVSDSLGNANGSPDPGEDLLITVPVTNPNTAAETATATIGTYTAQYGSLAASGSASKVIPFRVPATAAAGSTVIVPITVTGAYNAYTYNLPLIVGTPSYLINQTFDVGVTVPALPGGWTSTVATFATGGVTGTAWTTVSTPTVDSGNSAFAPDLAGNSTGGGESNLVSPVVTLPSVGPVQLSFKHTYALESTYDGGVLEIKIGAGAFTDIVAAGGSFVSGGYSGSVTATNYKNPIQGRAAWTGGPTTSSVLVNLPASALGQSVQLRWRLGFDNAISNTGWYVDTVRLLGAYTAASVDTDGDGLQNGYELANGLDPNNASDAALDSDGDGMTNLQEYLAGTNPKDATSRLGVTSTTYSPTAGTTVNFTGVNGKTYLVEYKDSLLASTWTTLQTGIIGSGGNVPITDAGAVGKPARFYRVRVTGP